MKRAQNWPNRTTLRFEPLAGRHRPHPCALAHLHLLFNKRASWGAAGFPVQKEVVVAVTSAKSLSPRTAYHVLEYFPILARPQRQIRQSPPGKSPLSSPPRPNCLSSDLN